MEQIPSTKENQQLEEKTLKNNDKQIDVYNPVNTFNDDIPIPKSVPDPDPAQCSPVILPSVGAFTVQCGACYKWRLIPTKKKYEEIRENIMEKPFSCDVAREWRAEISCDQPSDVEQDGSMLWAIDKPSIAQTPLGWERELRIRRHGSFNFADVYYVSPTGKRLRSIVQVHKYLMEHPESISQGVTLSQFSFQTPKPLQENYVRKRTAHFNTSSGECVQGPSLDDPTALQLNTPALAASDSKGSFEDATPPVKKKSRSSSKHTFINHDSMHSEAQRFMIELPFPPPSSIH